MPIRRPVIPKAPTQAKVPASPKVPSLLSNISWLGFANAAVKPLWFAFVTFFCMRLLGVEGYGVMNASLSLAMLAAAFTDLGMTQYTTREIARDRSSATSLFSNFLALRLVNVSLAWAAAVGAGVALGYRGSALLALVFAGAYVLSLQVANYCKGIYRGFEDLRLESVLLFVEKALVIGGGMLFLFVTSAAHWTLAGMAAGMLVTTLISIAWIRRHLVPLALKELDLTFTRSALANAIPFGLAGFFIAFFFRIDMVMVEAILGLESAGQYGAAFRIFEALNVLPTVVSLAAVYPRLSHLQHRGEYKAFSKLLRRTSIGLLALSTVITVAVFASAQAIIHLLDPDPLYAPAAGALQILAWRFPLFCIITLLYSALMTLDDQRFVAKLVAGGVLASIVLNFVLIPRMGIDGAAIATVCAEFLMFLGYVLRYRYRNSRLSRSLAADSSHG